MVRIAQSKAARCNQHRTALHGFLLPDFPERYTHLNNGIISFSVRPDKGRIFYAINRIKIAFGP